MNKTGIEWCDYTWNPLVGCSPASEGCDNCYAEVLHKNRKLPWGSPKFKPDRLEQPSKVRKPSRVFVCSMSDIFHPATPPIAFARIMEQIVSCERHTFILLTKRPENIPFGFDWPANVWLGITGETQRLAIGRWSQLQYKTLTAAPGSQPTVMFVSVEPMLTPVSFKGFSPDAKPGWVIAGPETGSNRRPCESQWIDDLSGESPVFFDKRKKNWCRREWPDENDLTPSQTKA